MADEAPGGVKQNLARFSSREQPVLLTLGVMVVVAVVLVVSWRASRPSDSEQSESATVGQTTNGSSSAGDLGLISSWPAGQMVGVGPSVAGAVLDGEGCALVPPGETLETSHVGQVSAIWVTTDPGNQVRIDWEAATRSESFIIPQSHLEHEFIPGRVTVTLAETDEPAEVSFVALAGSARVCGLRTRVGALISSWPAGLIEGTNPLAPEGVRLEPGGCATVADGDEIDLRIVGAGSVQMFTAIDATATLTWSDSIGADSMTIPREYLENEFTMGRVTVTFSQPEPEAVVTAAASGADLRICGLLAP